MLQLAGAMQKDSTVLASFYERHDGIGTVHTPSRVLQHCEQQVNHFPGLHGDIAKLMKASKQLQAPHTNLHFTSILKKAHKGCFCLMRLSRCDGKVE